MKEGREIHAEGTLDPCHSERIIIVVLQHVSIIVIVVYRQLGPYSLPRCVARLSEQEQ